MEESYLNRLIGQTIQEVTSSVNSIYAINKSEGGPDDALTISIVIVFEEYTLSINNKLKIIPNGYSSFSQLEGLKIIKVIESKEMAEFYFDNGGMLSVDLRDEGYLNDPEAMCLSGPNDFWVVWN